MRTTSLLAVLASTKAAFAKGPFLQQVSSTQWIIGNDLWNLTQGSTYATNLQYQGTDAVGKAQGHYAGYGMLMADLNERHGSKKSCRWRGKPQVYVSNYYIQHVLLH